MKIRSSETFKDGEPPEDAEDPEEEAKKLMFPWHCEKGIPENIRKLNTEYVETRKLKPVKIFISGPPASGKTEFGKNLKEFFNIPLIEVKELVEKAHELSNIEEDPDEFS